MSEDTRPPHEAAGTPQQQLELLEEERPAVAAVDTGNTADLTPPPVEAAPAPHYRIYLNDGKLAYHDGTTELTMDPERTAAVLRRQFTESQTQAPCFTPVWLAPGISGCLRNGRVAVLSMMIPALPFTAGTRFFPNPSDPTQMWFIPEPMSMATRTFLWRPSFPVPSFVAFSIRIAGTYSGSVDQMTEIPETLFGQTSIKCFVHLVTDGETTQPLFRCYKLPMPNTFNDGSLCMGDSFSATIRDQLLAPWNALIAALDLFVRAPWGRDLCPSPSIIASCFRWDAVTGKQVASNIFPARNLSVVTVAGVSEALSMLHAEWVASDRLWDHVLATRETIKNRLDPYWRNTQLPEVLPCPEVTP